MNLSALLLTPPPMIMRFGHISLLDPVEVLVEVGGPRLPRQPAPDAGDRRRAVLRGPTADLHLAELGVRDEDAVDEHARPDAGPEGQEDDDAGLVPPIPKRISAMPAASASLMIVTGRLIRRRHPLDDREVDPGGVDVGGGLEDAIDGHAGQPDADRRRVAETARPSPAA